MQRSAGFLRSSASSHTIHVVGMIEAGHDHCNLDSNDAVTVSNWKLVAYIKSSRAEHRLCSPANG